MWGKCMDDLATVSVEISLFCHLGDPSREGTHQIDHGYFTNHIEHKNLLGIVKTY